MMDLAEIRKKAKQHKDEAPPAEQSSLDSSVESAGKAVGSIQGSPIEDKPLPVEEQTAVAQPPAGEPEVPAVDRLDALFSAPAEISLATEESYLQGLTAVAEKQQDLCQWLTFFLGKEQYALDIGEIREIIKPREVTDIPRVPDFILGIISLRGIIIPIFDLSRRLNLGVGEITKTSRIIVAQHGDRVAGLLVDSITHVVQVPCDSVEPPPAALGGIDRNLVEGVGRHDKRMMILLNLSQVLDPALREFGKE